jgi:hypothetical protein
VLVVVEVGVLESVAVGELVGVLVAVWVAVTVGELVGVSVLTVPVLVGVEVGL